MMMAGGMMGGGWWGPGLGPLHWLLTFWILIIAGVALIVRWLFDKARASGAHPDETAFDVLKKRYAKGAVTTEEFVRMRAELR